MGTDILSESDPGLICGSDLMRILLCSCHRNLFIRRQVRTLLKDSYERTRTLLTSKHRELDIIAKGLLEHESLSGLVILYLHCIYSAGSITRTQSISPFQLSNLYI